MKTGIFRTIMVIAIGAVIAFGFGACPNDTNGKSHTHEWDEGTVTKAATCIEAGQKTRVCKLDATHTKTETIDIDLDNGHLMQATENVTTEPDCENPGVGVLACTREGCDHIVPGGEIVALGHKYPEEWTVITKAATCKDTGIGSRECTVCKKTETIIPIDNNAHVWDEYVQTTAPTCSAKGLETRVCLHHSTVTDTVKKEVAIDPTAHQWHFNASTSIETGICEHNLSETRLKDSRDGKTYKIVKIGDQTWMAENLNYGEEEEIGVWYNNNKAANEKYGRLYNWDTVMNGSASSTANPSGVRGIAPAGWHIPSDAEWNVLMAVVHSDNGLAAYTSGTATGAGKYLKAANGWNSRNGEDKYGFTALPGGAGNSGGSFSNLGGYGNWWSASENGSNVYYRYMSYLDDDVRRINGNKSDLYSVRCVMDE